LQDSTYTNFQDARQVDPTIPVNSTPLPDPANQDEKAYDQAGSQDDDRCLVALGGHDEGLKV